jgi:ribonucleotide reductase alpha subunit
VNVAKFAQGSAIDWERLGKTVELAVRFLDDVVEANRYPLPEIEAITRSNRKVGLGIMGFADLLVKLGVPYDSPGALELAEKLASFVEARAIEASRALAVERGPFPAWPGSLWATRGEKPLRNATVTTIAPTGTIAIIAGCSSGIEPLFAVSYHRRALDGGAVLSVVHPELERIARERGCRRLSRSTCKTPFRKRSICRASRRPRTCAVPTSLPTSSDARGSPSTATGAATRRSCPSRATRARRAPSRARGPRSAA